MTCFLADVSHLATFFFGCLTGVAIAGFATLVGMAIAGRKFNSSKPQSDRRAS